MTLPTEPIGSIPRPRKLQQAVAECAAGRLTPQELDAFYEEAVADTVRRFEATGSPVITDGEQTKSSFATYPLAGLPNLAPDGIVIPFEDGHTRQLPRLVSGPFRYSHYAGSFLCRAQKYSSLPFKQAVISASALSLIYPAEGISGYPREQFLDDLVNEAAADIRSCLDHGAVSVQIDFTEARLAIKLDPTKALLQQFIHLNNRVLSHFTFGERQRIGIHTCPGGDHNSTHSADVPYEELIPHLMTLDAGSFFFQMASEPNPARSLASIATNLKEHHRIYIGVIDVISEVVETIDQVRDRVLLAGKYIPAGQLGTTDDCGFSPFQDDVVTARETAFSKIEARVRGTASAAALLRSYPAPL